MGIVEWRDVVALLNSTVYSYESRLQIEERKRNCPQLFTSPRCNSIRDSRLVFVLCIHHQFSLFLFPRGWRKFVFQLIDMDDWTDEDWKEFDLVEAMRAG